MDEMVLLMLADTDGPERHQALLIKNLFFRGRLLCPNIFTVDYFFAPMSTWLCRCSMQNM
jgi:hypothetical protein